MENDFEDEAIDIEGLEKDAELDFEEDDATEEEREKLLAQIKNEIRLKVRKELQSDKLIAQLEDPAVKVAELEHLPANAIETGDLSAITDEKLREAIIQMRKYDAILSLKVENEREVKRSRLIERQRIRREMMATLTRSGGNVKSNIDHFFEADSRVLGKYYTGIRIPAPLELEAAANAAPAAIAYTLRDELTRVEADEMRAINGSQDESHATPIFQTQIDDYADRPSERSNGVQRNTGSGVQQAADVANDAASGSSASKRPAGKHASEGRESNVSGATSSTSKSNAKGAANRNFIRRNIELAAHAKESIALTTDERDRIDRLLSDMTAFGDDAPLTYESGEGRRDATPSTDRSRFSLLPVSAFSGELDEVERLREIETRLNVYMDVVESVRTPSVSTVSRPPSDAAPDTDRLGECTLQELKDAREQRATMAAIDGAISDFRAPRIIQAKPLARGELDSLVQGSLRALSRTSTDASSFRPPSSRFSRPEALIELRRSADSSARSSFTPTGRELVTPLDSDMLRRLLDEARREGVMYVPQSLIGTIAEEDEQQQLSDEPVSDETWRLISEEQPDPAFYSDEARQMPLVRASLSGNTSSRLSTASSSRTLDETAVASALPVINLTGNMVTQPRDKSDLLLSSRSARALHTNSD